MPIRYRSEPSVYCTSNGVRPTVHSITMPIVQALAFLFSFAALWFLFQVDGVCVRCGGRGGHREGCRVEK
jgi:hypothetical protein